MKISVITLQNIRNYGSVLQTFATQKILEKMGYEVEFIDYIRESQTKSYKIKEALKNVPTKNKFRYIHRKCKDILVRNKRAEKVFDGFIDANICTTRCRYCCVEQLRKNTPLADIYCTGSDQMWNSGWNGGIEYSYFLDFVDDDKPKFAFSTSIGMTDFPENEVEMTTRLLKRYNFITMREMSGVEILEKYGIKSENVLDPTLMVNGDFWRDFSNEAGKKYSKEKYILVYQLNHTHKNVDFESYVKKLSKETGLKIMAVTYGVPRVKVYDEYVHLPTMEEFVALFANAEYVVTDSFHGTSFCINLNKQFTVIYPDKYSTRLQNILKINNLQDRALSDNEKRIHNNLIDYMYVNNIMDKMRNNSLSIINDGLDNIKRAL